MALLSTWIGSLSEWLGVLAVTMILALSPRFKKRPVQFLQAEREGWTAISLFGVMFVLGFLYFTQSNITILSTDNPQLQTLAVRLVLAALCLIPFIASMRIRKQPLLSTGWSKANLRPSLQMGLALAIITLFLRGKFTNLLAGINTDQVIAMILWLALALVEETIFRGYIQLRFESWLGERWGWIGGAALFVLWQLPGRLFVLPFAELWPVLVIAAVQGLLCGFIMRKTGHSLAPALYRWMSGWVLML